MANKLDLAEAQLLGWHSAKSGESLISFVTSMGLTNSEWTKIKKQYPTTLNQQESAEIDEHFRVLQLNLKVGDYIIGIDNYFPKEAKKILDLVNNLVYYNDNIIESNVATNYCNICRIRKASKEEIKTAKLNDTNRKSINHS